MRYLLALLLLPSLLWAQETGYNVEPECGYYSFGCTTLVRTFNGTNQSFSSADNNHDTLELGTSDATLAFWGKYVADASVQPIYANGGDAAANKGIYLYVDASNKPTCSLADGATLFTSVADSAIADGWHAFGCRAERSANLELYVDGVQADATPADISSAAATDLDNTIALTVGTFSTDFWAGSLGIGAVWVGTIPTEANMLTDYNSGTPVSDFGSWTVTPTDGWAFNRGAGADEIGSHGVVLADSGTVGSGTGLGTTCPCAAKSRFGVRADAMHFTGADIHNSGAFTAGCFIYVNASGVNQWVIAEDDGTNRDWGLFVTGADALAAFGVSGGALAQTAGAAISLNAWHWAGVAFDGTNKIKRTLDGGAYATNTLAGALDDDNPGISVLANGVGGNPATARVGVCGYWTSELTAGASSQHEAIYNARETITCSTLQTTYGATHCWAMNGATGANENDTIGSVNLTQANGPYSFDGISSTAGCN